jgi:hypothetical protein
VPGYQCGKRFFGVAPGILTQQIHVIGRHLTYTFTPP